CHDGSISVYNVVFNTVHGLYQDRYAYRENMTDVVIQHLATDQRARIKCRDFVKKIAIYRDRLAVQLPDRIIIYELFHDDASDMHYRIKEKLQKKLDCSLLVVTTSHIILCLERKLQMYNFGGIKEREWNLDAMIRYIKVTGGPPNKEGLLVGLKSGEILQIFINNHFPIPLVKQITSVRCLDLSLSRTKLAVVDDHNTLFVYDVPSKTLLFQEPDTNSVAWNSEMEDMLCYSGSGLLWIKVGNLPAHQQKLHGFVVGFKGSRIFSLQVYTMTAVEIPQSAALDRYLEKREFKEAYRVACLNVTEGDWRRLAYEAMEGLCFEVARKAFVRVRDLKYIDLVRGFEVVGGESKYEPDLFLADIYTYAGRYHEAAKLYKRANKPQLAIAMYTDLNMWDHASLLATETNTPLTSILTQKAQTLQTSNDILAAAQTYIDLNEPIQAINLLGTHGHLAQLITVARDLPRSDTKSLSLCAVYFRKHGHHAYAAETLAKLGDFKHLLALHIEQTNWHDAFAVVEMHPQFASVLWLPYAEWLAANDRFMEAQTYFRKAGHADDAVRVLATLTRNAVTERRYDDASWYHWMLSREKSGGPHDELADLYHVYFSVFRYVEEPFVTMLPECILNMAKYVWAWLDRQPCPSPPGVSRVRVLLAITRLAPSLSAFKLARAAYEKIANLIVPAAWQDKLDVGAVTIRAAPFSDNEELGMMCYVCASVNAVCAVKLVCSNCKAPFVYSFYSFTTLPLVEFCVDTDITDDEALNLVHADPPLLIGGTGGMLSAALGSPKGGLVTTASERSLFSEKPEIVKKHAADLDGAVAIINEDDEFRRQMFARSGGAAEYAPIKLDRRGLTALNRHEVFVRSRNGRNQYFRKVVAGAG
ncbi:hypothetical protein HK096_004918, partial [Nowakowskiella sp. JEL0078]